MRILPHQCVFLGGDKGHLVRVQTSAESRDHQGKNGEREGRKSGGHKNYFLDGFSGAVPDLFPGNPGTLL
jgi:hypothetical protein